MKKIISLILISLISLASINMNLAKADDWDDRFERDDVIVLTSRYDFNTTVDKLQSAIQAKGNKIFAVIDHAAAARDVNLSLQPSKVIIYGNPRVGTPYMQINPYFALALPLKVLVTEVRGTVNVVYERADDVVDGYRFTDRDERAAESDFRKAEALIRSAIR